MVHAFEPWAPVRAQLVKNASLNAGARIVVHPFGLADVNENRPFHASLGGNQGIGAFEGGYTGRTRPWPTRCRRAAATMSWPKAWRRRPAGSRSMSRATSRWSSRGLAATLAKHRPLVALEYPEAGRGLYPQGRSPLSLMPEKYLFYVIVDRGGGSPRAVEARFDAQSRGRPGPGRAEKRRRVRLAFYPQRV